MRMRSASAWGVTAAALLSGTATAAQTPEPVGVPKAFEVAAQLAREGVTAGVVMCAAERRPDPEYVAGIIAPDAASEAAACDETNASLLQSRPDGVLHVRTAGQPHRVTEILNRRITLAPEDDVNATEAIGSRIRNAVRGWGSDGMKGSNDRRRASQPVRLRGGTTTVRHALDDVARQVPGLVWLLTFPPGDHSDFYLINVFHGASGAGVGLSPTGGPCALPCDEQRADPGPRR